MDNHPTDSTLDRRILLGAAGLAGIAALASGRAKAGPLNPPGGAVGSTGKTITEAEPRTAINAANTPGDADSIYRITQAGGYYLTANMLIATGKNGIEIAASGVTIDLNGFQLTGFGGLAGIVASSTALDRITIRNGSIVNCTRGISLASIPGVVVEGVSIESCSSYGIQTGDHAEISGCWAVGNFIGVLAGTSACIRDCRASGNSNVGIATDQSSTVSCCTAFDNASHGIAPGTGSLIVGCTARNNGGYGIFGSGGVVHGCSANNNTSDGIRAQDGCRLDTCSASGNDGNGISVAGGYVTNCTARLNNLNGISCANDSQIKNNHCGTNGFGGNGAGIAVFQGNNRIEGNNCIGGDRGIEIAAAGNIVIGNTVKGATTNWDVAAGNICYVVDAASCPAFTGNAGGTSPGSTSPWTNFTH